MLRKMRVILAALVLIVGTSNMKAQGAPLPGPCNDPFLNPEPDVPLCEQVEESVKCFIQDLGFHQDPDIPADFVDNFKSQLNFSLNEFNVTCEDIDVEDLLEELRREQLAPSANPDCVADDDSGSECAGRSNGDYLICDNSECAAGKYVTCSNQILYVRDCPLGWYVDDDGNRFTAPMVFNPSSGTCEPRSDSCPRDLDEDVEK